MIQFFIQIVEERPGNFRITMATPPQDATPLEIQAAVEAKEYLNGLGQHVMGKLGAKGDLATMRFVTGNPSTGHMPKDAGN